MTDTPTEPPAPRRDERVALPTRAPLHLEATVRALQRRPSHPVERWDGARYRRALRTPDGLALCRPDAQRRSFDLARVFSDAAGVVGPESRLLVGEGGSLYAVDHDEIRHVTFNP